MLFINVFFFFKFNGERQLKSSNGEKKHYTFISIVYSSLRFITFNKTESELRVFDDEIIYCFWGYKSTFIIILVI